MRIVAWNCNNGFDRKYPLLRDLDFDVAVVTECGPFETGLDQVRELSSVLRPAFDRPGYKKHIGVLAQAPWTVERLPDIPEMPWVMPVRIAGPAEFTLLAHWALSPDALERKPAYTAQTLRLIEEVIRAIDGPVVVAGDFNAGLISPAPSAKRHHTNVEKFAELGLVSAHTSAHPDTDPRDEPTLYWMWDREKPYHCDHIFIPEDWTEGLEVTVGRYEDWTEKRISDHVPVTADVRLG